MHAVKSGRVVALTIVTVLALAFIGTILGAQRAAGQNVGGRPPARQQGAQGQSTMRASGAQSTASQATLAARPGMALDASSTFLAARVAAIAVGDGKVFVVSNGTLYKFDTRSLVCEGSQRIPAPSASAGAAAAIQAQPGPAPSVQPVLRGILAK